MTTPPAVEAVARAIEQHISARPKHTEYDHITIFIDGIPEAAAAALRAATPYLTAAPVAPVIPEWATVQITKAPWDDDWQARLRGVTKDPHLGTEVRHSIYGEGATIGEALAAACQQAGGE